MNPTRARILETTAALFQRYGYTGTGIKQIVAGAAAPFGSVYHFFPGGKEQLGEEVIRRSGRMYLELVAAVYDAAPDAVTGIDEAFRGAATVLEATDYVDACPIATVALEVASSNDTLRAAIAEVFESWIEALSTRFVTAGVAVEQARPLAMAVIQLLEGGFMLSRTARTTEAMAAAGRAAVALVREAVAGRG